MKFKLGNLVNFRGKSRTYYVDELNYDGTVARIKHSSNTEYTYQVTNDNNLELTALKVGQKVRTHIPGLTQDYIIRSVAYGYCDLEGGPTVRLEDVYLTKADADEREPYRRLQRNYEQSRNKEKTKQLGDVYGMSPDAIYLDESQLITKPKDNEMKNVINKLNGTVTGVEQTQKVYKRDTYYLDFYSILKDSELIKDADFGSGAILEGLRLDGETLVLDVREGDVDTPVVGKEDDYIKSK